MFANNEAEKQCGRWNRGLRSSVPDEARFQLPREVGAMFDQAVGVGAAADQPEAIAGQAGSVQLSHPSLKGLSVKIDRNWQFAGLQMSPSYVLTFLDEPVAGELSHEPSQAALLALQRLTPTERRVAQLVAKGLRNDKIAEHLSRSRRTIEFQLNSIYRKLDISSRTELVRVLS